MGTQKPKTKKHYIKTTYASWLKTANVAEVKANLSSKDWDSCLVFDNKASAEAIAKFLSSIKGNETPKELLKLFEDICF